MNFGEFDPPGDGGGGDDRVDTVFADGFVAYDHGETIRLLYWRDELDCQGFPSRRRAQWTVLPRSGFLTALVALTETFLGSAPAEEDRAAGRCRAH